MDTVLELASGLDTRLNQHALNLAVWDRILADPSLAALDYRFETDEHGQIIMSPPTAPNHGNRQVEISVGIKSAGLVGKVFVECPISTSKGIKAAEVAWCSLGVWKNSEEKSCFIGAPEICVEVRSLSNTDSEIDEKRALYFEAGAEEVWICELDGTMAFFLSGDVDVAAGKSERIPSFPSRIE